MTGKDIIKALLLALFYIGSVPCLMIAYLAIAADYFMELGNKIDKW